MATVMVIGAVMVANIFTGLNTDSWTGWVWFGVLFGPVLIWIYTVGFVESTTLIPSITLTSLFVNRHILHHSTFGVLHVSIDRPPYINYCARYSSTSFSISYAFGNEWVSCKT